MESGSKKDNQDAFRALVNDGMAVVSADYGTYPTAKYPEFIEGAAAAVNWAFQDLNKYGACQRFYLAGSSAGAYIAMMLCFAERYLDRYGINPNDLAGYIFDAGQPTTHFNVLRERGLDPRKVVIDEAASIYHIREDSGRPPFLLIAAEHDLPNRLEQTMLFRSTLREFGYDDRKIEFKILQGYSHCAYYHAVENGKNIYAEIS